MGGDGGSGGALSNILSGTVAGFAQVAAGMGDCIRKTLAREGVLGLYAGAASPLLGAMAHNAGVFFSYGMAKVCAHSAIPSLASAIRGIAHCVGKHYKASSQCSQQFYSSISAQQQHVELPHQIYCHADCVLILALPVHCCQCTCSFPAACCCCEQNFVGKGEKLTIPQYYLAGSLAAIPISVVESPVDLFKIQLQAQVGKGKYNGVVDCAKQVYATQGVGGLYQGFGASLLRNIPCFGAYFFSFEATKAALTPVGAEPTLGTCFVAGGAAGFGFWGLWYPLETIKTRIQSDHPDQKLRVYKRARLTLEFVIIMFYCGCAPNEVCSHVALWSKSRCSLTVPARFVSAHKQELTAHSHCPLRALLVCIQQGIIDCFTKTKAEGGMRAFYKGYLPSLARAVPASYWERSAGSRQ
eukprot:10991-Heterococcus_DN1.PRE.3